MKRNFKLFIATTSFGKVSKDPIAMLDKSGFSYEFNNLGKKLSTQHVRDIISSFDGVIAGTEEYSKETLSYLPRLKVISRLGVGTDNIDLESAESARIIVKKCQTTPSLAVAELTLAMFINISRNLAIMNQNMQNQKWEKLMGRLVSNKTLGIIGLGTIGKKLVEITQGFNLEYLAFDLHQDREFSEQYNIKYLGLEELLKKSNLISIHLNSSPSNYKMINYEKFKLMKNKPILINTSRGEVIDENDLLKALDEDLLFGVGLDVFEKEPYDGSIVDYGNVFTTPHIGSYAAEIRNQMEIEAVENLIIGAENVTE